MTKKPEEDQTLEIPGVNTGHGIVSTGGTVAGYRKVLSTFGRDTMERLIFLDSYLNEEYDEKKASLFSVYAHSLKSALSFIGVQDLSDKAMALETAGKAGDQGYIKENLPDFNEKLTDLIKNIQKYVNSGSDNGGGGEIMSPECVSLLRELVVLLESKAAFSKIDNIIEEIEKKTVNSELREVLDLVSDEVLMTEYDNALQIIKKIV